MRKAIGFALLDAFLWTACKNQRGAPIAPPSDFIRHAGEITFRPGPFADRVAELLIMRGFRVNDEQEPAQ